MLQLRSWYCCLSVLIWLDYQISPNLAGSLRLLIADALVRLGALRFRRGSGLRALASMFRVLLLTGRLTHTATLSSVTGKWRQTVGRSR
jgi:hypothetical protein